MATIAIDIPEAQIADFCRKWRISELSLFGSVLREDFGPESDVDVLATFAGDASLSLLDMIAAEEELATILQRPVDLLARSAVERSENWIRRRSILSSAEKIYGQ